MKKISRICVLLVLIVFLSVSFAAGRDGKYILFVGTYTKDGSQGIYSYRFDERSGKLASLGLAAKTDNPSFLSVAPGSKFLYAVNEIRDYKGAASGGVTAFSMGPKTGKLRPLNEVASRGTDPCYISFDRSGKYALVANYSGGNVAVFPLSSDGRIGEASSVVKDAGPLGPNRARQEAAHAHFIEASARNRFVYVSDLGLDRVLIYKFDATKGNLSTGRAESHVEDGKDFFSATLAPGTGPRHIAFSADGNFMYVIGELDSTVTVFANDERETFRAIQQISTRQPGSTGANGAAEIVLHPSGKFLYASNRGDDSIAVFSVDRESGKLTVVEQVPSGGRTPRMFALDPDGSHLLVANQDSGNIVEFRVDAATGRLKRVGDVVKVPSPVCLVFVPEE
ncbi:MAG: lactonase family protein [Terriglobales bacterium]|jgi:6-phosphogluconolactonase